MRLSSHLLPLILLVFLPFYASWNAWGVFKVLLASVAIFLFRTVQMIKKPILDGKNTEDAKLVLESLHMSLYVEKVRWCLDYAGIPYTEEQDCSALGRFFLGRSVPRLKVPAKEIFISNSSDILRYLYGISAGRDEQLRKFFEASKEISDLEKRLDIMGEDMRRYSYYHRVTQGAATPENMRKVWGIHQTRTPKWQKLILNATIPLMLFLASKTMVDTRPESAEKSRKNFRKVLDEVDALLSDGRKFLQNTSEPTYIDLVFASLAQILVRHPNYGGGATEPQSVEDFTLLGKVHAKERDELLARPCGKLVVRLCQDYRLAKLRNHPL